MRKLLAAYGCELVVLPTSAQSVDQKAARMARLFPDEMLRRRIGPRFPKRNKRSSGKSSIPRKGIRGISPDDDLQRRDRRRADDGKFSVEYQVEASGTRSQGPASLSPGGKKKAAQGIQIGLDAAK